MFYLLAGLHILSESLSFVCRPPPAVDCAVNIVSEQCGAEVASYARVFVSKLLTELGCVEGKRQCRSLLSLLL